MSTGIYVHIPFCASHCHYCHFYSAVVREEMYDFYLAALLKEIANRPLSSFSNHVDSIYFGGGTPSLFGVQRIHDVLLALRERFAVQNTAEVTLEMNPDGITRSDLEAYYAAGINRLSVGVQTFRDDLLQRIGRIHRAQDARRVIKDAAHIGFKNITLDLMYGLPGHSAADFKESLVKAVHLPITHISVYGLIVEPGTLFARLAAQGRLDLPSEETEWEMYQTMVRTLPQYGFSRYEIANFAKSGYEAVHNQKYWRYEPYIGFGAAAVSFDGNVRYSHVADWQAYIKQIDSARWIPQDVESIDRQTAMEEYCFMNLRRRSGISMSSFATKFGVTLQETYGKELQTLLEERLLYRATADTITLTRRGTEVANQVFTYFIRT